MSVGEAVTGSFVSVVVCVTAAVAIAFASAGGRGQSRGQRATRGALAVAALGGWLALTDRVAASGVLLDFSGRPPPFSKLVVAATIGTVLVALSPLGGRLARALPLSALVGFQAFRIPVELILAELHREGAIPVQMTYRGLNFDVAAGLSAALVAYLAHRRKMGPRAIFAWNTAGLMLLGTIVVVANLSTPAFRVFTSEPPTVLLATRMFVWLPTVLVQAALLGHLLTYRKLAHERQAWAHRLAAT
jgi:hypothetical protein